MEMMMRLTCILILKWLTISLCVVLSITSLSDFFIGANFKLHLVYVKFLCFIMFVIIYKGKYISHKLEEKLKISNS